jgi:radical SAM protein with 4Fe4S-binding SPASM domain
MALCKAPVNNMYFTVHGTVAPCWLTVGAIDRWSPTHSISDIWFGEKYQQIRDNIANDIFKGKCAECKKDIDNGVWPLAKAYDQFTVKKYPSLMELELSNQCNLECVMCSGTLSSGIRKNRDKLPPLPQIYTDEFRQQLREFIPHLEELRFNGGEPFAQKIVLDICEDVAELNPRLKVNIATNGTVYNKRVQKILDICNIHINISIDSLLHDRYSEIRINGDLSVLMKNFEIFNKYCKDGNRDLSIMVNPMRQNWDEMVEFVKWTDKHHVKLWYNTIRYPADCAIWNLPSEKLKEIHTSLQAELDSIPMTTYNYDKADHLINRQIANWLLESYE